MNDPRLPKFIPVTYPMWMADIDEEGGAESVLVLGWVLDPSDGVDAYDPVTEFGSRESTGWFFFTPEKAMSKAVDMVERRRERLGLAQE